MTVIDAHAHLVAPEVFYSHRSRLLAAAGHHRDRPRVSDAEVAEAAAHNISVMDAVGTDVQLISPRPFQQMHSAKPDRIVHWWMEANNNMIAQTVGLHPTRLAGVAGLPVCAGAPVEDALPELSRAVEELGFVGVSLNPDPYEGTGPSPLLEEKYWYPLWERVCELDVPVLIHPGGCYSGRESYSEHFITEESLAVLSLMRSSVFDDFPEIKLIVAHGGGSVPYQLGRWQAEVLLPVLGGDPENARFEVRLRRLWFDTVLHHRPALELLFKTVGADRCLFGTERPGSGSAINPETGLAYDDLRPVIEDMEFLSEEEKKAILGGTAKRLFSRLEIGD